MWRQGQRRKGGSVARWLGRHWDYYRSVFPFMGGTAMRAAIQCGLEKRVSRWQSQPIAQSTVYQTLWEIRADVKAALMGTVLTM